MRFGEWMKSALGACVLTIASVAATTSDAATFKYRLMDHPDGGHSKNAPFAEYGLRLDQYGSYWSYENGGNVTMEIDDGGGAAGAGMMTISGLMRQSFGALNTPSFGNLWSISYTITGLTVGAQGTFVDTGGTGSGWITDTVGGTNYALGSKANRAGQYFLFLDDGHRVPGGSQLIGRGWVDNASNLSGANDMLFTVTPMPLPAAGWMLLCGLGLFGVVKRRKAI